MVSVVTFKEENIENLIPKPNLPPPPKPARYIYQGNRGIAPTRDCTHILKNVLNLFICIKLNFFLTMFLTLSHLFSCWI